MNHDKSPIERCKKTGRWKPTAAMYTPGHKAGVRISKELNTKELDIAYQNRMNVDDLRNFLLRSQGDVNK